MITDKRIDGGKGFDWGRTSQDYALYRDIYPTEFYERIAAKGLCTSGQRVLDLGTGTGVLPRNMYRFGAKWTGTDISPEQIGQAKAISEREGKDIELLTASAETLDFPAGSFDVITACQCFFYFDHEVVIPKLAELLTDGGKLLILYMAWLPFDDERAGASESLVLKYNPAWSGAGETRRPIGIPEIAGKYFTVTDRELYDIPVHFTRESWHGRIRASRGVGASLSPEELSSWEAEHRALVAQFPEEFDILHYAASVTLQKK